MKLSGIFVKTLYDHRLSIFFWFTGVFLMLVMYVSLFPAVAESDELAQAMNNMPQEFQALFGDLSTITTPEGYIHTELFSLTLPLLLVIVFVILGSGLINREESSGTIELLLSRPISRTRIVLEKILAMHFVVGVISLSVVAGLMVGKSLVNFPIDILNFAMATLISYLLAGVFGLLAFCLTTIKPNRGLSVGVSVVIFILGFIIVSFASSVETFKAIQILAPNYYYQPLDVLRSGVNWGDFGVLTAISVLLVAISVWAFNRRDVGI